MTKHIVDWYTLIPYMKERNDRVVFYTTLLDIAVKSGLITVKLRTENL